MLTGKTVIVWALAAAVSVMLLAAPAPARAELSVEAYCDLFIKALDADIALYQELARVNGRSYESPAEREIDQQRAFEAHKLALEALYAQYETNGQEVGLFMGAKGPAVNAYLEENQSVKSRIVDLSEKRNYYGGMVEEFKRFQ
jgi:hypothetical protein